MLWIHITLMRIRIRLFTLMQIRISLVTLMQVRMRNLIFYMMRFRMRVRILIFIWCRSGSGLFIWCGSRSRSRFPKWCGSGSITLFQPNRCCIVCTIPLTSQSHCSSFAGLVVIYWIMYLHLVVRLFWNINYGIWAKTKKKCFLKTEIILFVPLFRIKMVALSAALLFDVFLRNLTEVLNFCSGPVNLLVISAGGLLQCWKERWAVYDYRNHFSDFIVIS